MEKQTKTSTSFLLSSSLVLLVVLLTSPLGYQYGLVPLQPSLAGLMISFVGGALVVFVGLVFLIIAIRANLVGNRSLLSLTIFIGMIPLVSLLPVLLKAIAVPSINDISTDTVHPPEFVTLLPLRVGAETSAEYGESEAWSADELSSITRVAYPEIKTQRIDLSTADAVYRSVAILEDMGLEIMSSDVGEGRIEAVATSFWFGFKDDLVVRIVEVEGQVLIDLRSKSRVGLSDMGANASRIREFIRRF